MHYFFVGGVNLPRRKRVRSEYGCYHTMLRGINKMVIFHDDNDRKYFLSRVEKVKKATNFILYAYCLMDNHVHLVIRERTLCTEDEDISRIMHKIGVAYARYYNEKYVRVGHLFQDRFKSTNVETTESLLHVISYVLKNPMKHATDHTIEQYNWSSAKEYCQHAKGITDVSKLLQLLGPNPTTSLKRLKNYIYSEENTSWQNTIAEKISLARCKLIWESICASESSEEDCVKLLFKITCLSHRKIAEVTEINRRKIKEYLQKK